MRRAAFAALVVGLLIWFAVQATPPAAFDEPSASTRDVMPDPPRPERERAATHDQPADRPAEAVGATSRHPAQETADESASIIAFRVSVALRDGSPCPGVGVHLRRTYPDGAVWTPRLEFTDDDGLAGFPDLAEPGSRLDVAASGPFLTPVTAPVPRLAEHGDPVPTVRLVLPHTCVLECEVVDAAGTAVRDGWIYLRGAEDSARHPPRDEGDLREDAHVARAAIDRGRARFQFVPPARDLEVLVPGRNLSERTGRAEIRSGATGSTTHVRVVLGAPRPIVEGRLVDVQGQPVAGISVFADALLPNDDGARRTHDGEGVSDDAGWFRLPLDVEPTEVRGFALLLARRLDATDLLNSTELLVRPIPQDWAGGVLSLGEVSTTAQILIASGVVVGPDGGPIRGATVAALRPAGDHFWPRHDVAAATTGPDGRFAIHGPASDDVTRLGVTASGFYLSRRPDVPAGARDIQITLTRAGSLAGRVVAPEGISLSSLRVVLSGEAAETGTAEGYRPRNGREVELRDGGRFEIGGLRPGAATLSVRTGWYQDSDLVTVDGLQVIADEVTVDPRLDPLDLGACCGIYTVTVQTPDGHPIQDAIVHYRAADSHGAWDESAVDADGRAAVMTGAFALEVLGTAPGHRAVAARATPGAVTLELRPVPMTTVEMVIASGSPFPGPPYFLSTELFWKGLPGSDEGTDADVGADPRDVDAWNRRFGAGRTARVELWEPGRYEIAVYLWRAEVDGPVGRPVAVAQPRPVIEVDGSGRPVRVDLSLDASDVKRLLAADEE